MSELAERNDRSKNVLLFNIPESSAHSIDDKVRDDLNHVCSVLDPLGSFPQPKKIVRLGLPKPNVIRPLKIIYENSEEAKNILRSNKNNTNKQFHFHADLTKLQRESNSLIIKEFKEKISKGDNKITLRYKNNMAFISKKREVHKSPKN